MADQGAGKRKYGDINTVTLYVGQSETAFHVHEDLLCEYSSFFKVAFSSEKFREGLDKEMTLLEEDEDDFEGFVNWLYTQRRDFAPIDTQEQEGIAKMTNVRLFILADKYDVTSLKKQICSDMVRLFKDCKDPPPQDVLALAYSQLPAKSGMRKILLDWWVGKSAPKWYDEDSMEQWLHSHPETAVDLVKGLTKRAATKQNWKSPLWGPVSAYYDEDSK